MHALGIKGEEGILKTMAKRTRFTDIFPILLMIRFVNGAVRET